MEEKKYISKVIALYLQRRYGRKTEEKVQRWLIDETDAEDKNRSLEAYWDSLPESSNSKTYVSLAQLKMRLGIDNALAKKTSSRRSWLRVAAVLLPFFLAGSYFLLMQTWENRGDFITISVPYGESREIKLPDASTAFLNAGSALEYPASFGNKKRYVKLIGEAYFSISKDASKTFVVETEQLLIKVLGTEFNVKAYPDETRTIATLNSGKIESETKDGKSYTLTPNQQILYDRQTDKTTVMQVDADMFSGWKNGYLIFENMPLYEILPTIERKFNVSIQAEQGIDADSHYSIKFVNGERLEEIMKVICETAGFSCSMDNRTIRIMKK